MIPPDELERFAECARNAWHLAARGCVREGYLALDLGLTWAETPALDPVTGLPHPPASWARELGLLYQRELARFLAIYEVDLGPVSLSRRLQVTCGDSSELRSTARSICERSEQLRARAEMLTKRATELAQSANELQGRKREPR